MIFEWDDLGANRVISDMCRSHDCRDQLDRLHIINPAFKCTLFAIPGEMTSELLEWCHKNHNWVELGWHGFFHSSNYECEKMSYQEFDMWVDYFKTRLLGTYFVNGFRAPGWQISDDIYRWLLDHDWWVADQNYNSDRRPEQLKAYVNNSGIFYVPDREHPHDMAYWEPVPAYHGHVWDVGEKGNEPNGIYEDFEKVSALVKDTKDFKFISELFT